MKIRNGFVSNSSSASYIVKINGSSFEDLCARLLCEYSWCEFNLVAVLGKISNRITEASERLQTGEIKPFYDKLIEDLEALLKEAKDIDEDNGVEVVDFILKYNGIEYQEDSNEITLFDCTSMHNSYDEGVSDLLQEIIMFILFETDYKIKCEIDKD